MAHCEVASGDYESIPLAGSDDVVRQVACRAEGLILTLFTARVGLMIHAHPRTTTHASSTFEGSVICLYLRSVKEDSTTFGKIE